MTRKSKPPAPTLTPRVFNALRMHSLALYAQETLSGPRVHGGKFVIAPHHEKWCDMVQTSQRVSIKSSRGHGKTMLLAKAYALWMAERFPNETGFIFSAAADQAKQRMQDIIDEVTTNPKLEHLYPRTKNKQLWGARGIRLANGHTIYARGYGSRVRGGHPRWIVCDDILSDNSAYSDVVRKKEIDYFYQAIIPMLMPDSRIVVIGTPMNRADLLAHLDNDPQFVSATFPAFDRDGNPLWAAQFSKEKLLAEQKSMGTVRFSREFLCVPVADAASLFPGHLFVGPDVERPEIKLGMPRETWNRLGIHDFYIGVDFGLSASVSADFTVIWTTGLDRWGNRWIVDITREKGLSYSEQKAAIRRPAEKYRAASVFVEAIQAQRIFGEELQKETDLPIHLFHTTEKKHALTGGLPSLRILFENKKIRIPTHPDCDKTRELIDAWIGEMQGLTVDRGKVVSVAEHDDLPMAFWISEQAIARGGFSFSFGEQPGDKEAFDELLAELRASEDDVDEFDDPIPSARRGPPGHGNLDFGDNDAYGPSSTGMSPASPSSPSFIPLLGPWGRF